MPKIIKINGHSQNEVLSFLRGSEQKKVYGFFLENQYKSFSVTNIDNSNALDISRSNISRVCRDLSKLNILKRVKNEFNIIEYSLNYDK